MVSKHISQFSRRHWLGEKQFDSTERSLFLRVLRRKASNRDNIRPIEHDMFIFLNLVACQHTILVRYLNVYFTSQQSLALSSQESIYLPMKMTSNIPRTTSYIFTAWKSFVAIAYGYPRLYKYKQQLEESAVSLVNGVDIAGPTLRLIRLSSTKAFEVFLSSGKTFLSRFLSTGMD